MTRLLSDADRILHGNLTPAGERGGIGMGTLTSLIILCGLLYGGAMGTFAGIRGDRLLQVLYSALKVPLLLGVTFIVALPSFFVINTLFGLRDDFVESLRALAGTQAAMTLILVSLSPITMLWYASSADYPAAILFNALMFGIASIAAQRILRVLYRPLIQRNPRHRTMIRLWIVLFAFVGIQAGYVMRPFVGDPRAQVQFFRDNAWGNAYEVVFKMAWGLFR